MFMCLTYPAWHDDESVIHVNPSAVITFRHTDVRNSNNFLSALQMEHNLNQARMNEKGLNQSNFERRDEVGWGWGGGG